MSKRIVHIIPSVILYLSASILAAYAIWSYTYCADIISQAKAVGQLAASGNEYDIASFYMGNCGQFFVYALLLIAAGLLLQRKPTTENDNDRSIQFDRNKAVDDELDEWFEAEVHSEHLTSKDE